MICRVIACFVGLLLLRIGKFPSAEKFVAFLCVLVRGCDAICGHVSRIIKSCLRSHIRVPTHSLAPSVKIICVCSLRGCGAIANEANSQDLAFFGSWNSKSVERHTFMSLVRTAYRKNKLLGGGTKLWVLMTNDIYLLELGQKLYEVGGMAWFLTQQNTPQS